MVINSYNLTTVMIFLIWIFHISQPRVSNGRIWYFSHYQDKSNGSVYSIPGISFAACSEECMTRPTCDVVNYLRRHLRCEIEEYDFQRRQNSVTSKLRKKAGWVYSEPHQDNRGFAGCNCRSREKCNIMPSGKWNCTTSHCISPSKTLNNYGVKGNIASIGGKAIVYCQLPTLPDVNGSHLAMYICSSDGNWDLISRYLSCEEGKEIFRGFKHKSGIKLAWDTSSQDTTNNSLCLDALSLDMPNCSKHYRSSDIDRWRLLNISRVLFSVVKNNRLVHHIVFNGTDSTSNDWFSHGRVLQSSWSDLKTSTPRVFSIRGETYNTTYSGDEICYRNRRFVITRTSDNCSTDSGWFLTTYGKPNKDHCCEYDRGDQLSLLYAKGKVAALWDQTNDTERADYFNVYIYTN